MSFHPYLAFAGNCRDAFTRYQEIFGGELVVLTGADVPPEAAAEMSPDAGDMVLHAALMVGDQLLMGADAPGGTFDGQNRGMCCNVSVDELAEAERVFAALSDGGEVQMPLTADLLLTRLRDVRRPVRHPVDGGDQRPQRRHALTSRFLRRVGR